MPHCYRRICLALIVSSCGISIHSAQAQRVSPDFLVTTSGDTLRGHIEANDQQQSVQLYRRGSPPTTFTASQLTSYGTSQKRVLQVSRQAGVHGSAILLTPLVLGYVNLYTGFNADHARRFFLQPTDSTYAIEVDPVSAQLTYVRVLPGCPTMEFGYDKMQVKYPYTGTGTRRLVEDYNLCRQPQQPSHEVRQPFGLHVTFGVKAGVNYSSFNFTTDNYSSGVYATGHSSAVGYQAGVLAHFESRSRFSVQTELNYLTLRSNYGPGPAASYNSGINFGTYSDQIRFAQLQVPLLFRYTFGLAAGVRPYLNIGPTVAYNIQNSSTRSHYGSAPYQTDFVPTSKGSVGATGGIGIITQSASRLGLSTELRYDVTSDTTPGIYGGTSTNHNSLRLDVGVLF